MLLGNTPPGSSGSLTRLDRDIPHHLNVDIRTAALFVDGKGRSVGRPGNGSSLLFTIIFPGGEAHAASATWQAWYVCGRS